MQKTTFLTIALAMVTQGQTIQTEKSNPRSVIQVKTTLNHLSVIELAEPVTDVAVGSQSYEVTRHGNKVFVEPLEPEAATNLFIWTASGRFTYELVAGPLAEAQLAIDQEPGQLPARTAAPAPSPVPDSRAAEEAKLASQILFAGHPVRLSGDLKHGRVQVVLKDVYRSGNRIYVRYCIQNDARVEYKPGAPGVIRLRAPHSSQSLYSLTGTQIAGDHVRVTANGETPVKVINAEVHSATIPPGSIAFGVVAFEAPDGSGPTVVRFAFPSDSMGEVTALLVL